MYHDPSPPKALEEVQQWFGRVVAQPISVESQLLPHSGAEQAPLYVSPSSSLTPMERIEIYSQQYWWRLLNALQENFPFLTRLFGSAGFNEAIGKPALAAYPPSHWSLTHLGDELVEWLEENYHHRDRALILDAARIDWAIATALTATELEPLVPSDLGESLLDHPLQLQPHLYLFHCKANLFAYREIILERDLDGWVNESFPPMVHDGNEFFALFRNQKLTIEWKPLTKGEFNLLTALAEGTPLREACKEINKIDIPLLAQWTQEWTIRKWIAK